MKWFLQWLRRPSYAKLARENETLRRDFDDLVSKKATITDIALRNGALTIESGSELAHLMAEKFAKVLETAENYVEMQFIRPADKRMFTVTLRWHAGLTPAQKEHAVRKQLDEIREHLRGIDWVNWGAPNMTLVSKACKVLEIRSGQ